MATFVRRGGTAQCASFSTGVHGFDTAFMGPGGGVPAGAMVALHEETQRRSAGVSLSVLRCFAAEGLVTGQRLLVISAQGKESLLGALEYLPAVRERKQPGAAQPGAAQPSAAQPGGEAMRIAWRYSHLPSAAAGEQAARRTFDLRSRMDTAAVADAIRVHAVDFAAEDWAATLATAVRSAVEGAKQSSTALRIVLPSVGSSAWPYDAVVPALHAVRCAIRNAPCAAIATLAAHLLPADVSSTAHALCDGVVAASALPEPPAGAQRAEYAVAALRALVPVRAPGTLVGGVPACDMAAVRSSAGRVLRVEPLYIPPEDSVAAGAACSSPSLEF